MNAFAVALLGTLIFPREDKNIDTRLIYIVRTLAKGSTFGENTLVPMILAEMIRTLSKCIRGKNFFEGCNFFVQLWEIEHFYKRANSIYILNGLGNKIHTHPIRMRRFVAPVCIEEWFRFMRGLSGYNIQWKYYWLNPSLAI